LSYYCLSDAEEFTSECFKFTRAEQTGIAVTLLTYIRECSVRISVWTPAILTKVSCGFPQFLQVNRSIVPRLGHDRITLAFETRQSRHRKELQSKPHEKNLWESKTSAKTKYISVHMRLLLWHYCAAGRFVQAVPLQFTILTTHILQARGSKTDHTHMSVYALSQHCRDNNRHVLFTTVCLM
jgi:hypothetical protein